LRQFLVDTIDLQAQFLIARLQDALPKMVAQAADRENVQIQFGRVASSPQGCYALVDYVNFKGEGTLATERYHGQGWGLLQVLENMHGTQSALDEFAASAKTVLRRRVAKDSLGRSSEFVERGLRAVHIFQDLEQAPTLAVITFSRERAFAFKIYVVNQRVTALSARSDAAELELHVFAISGLGDHFGQGVLQACDQKL